MGGLGREFLDVAGGHLIAACHDGLMVFRTLLRPPLVPARRDGPLLGAAELYFDRVLSEPGVPAWTGLALLAEPAEVVEGPLQQPAGPAQVR